MSMIFMFPGQGSQKVGMGKDLFETFPEARERFNQADEILGRNISEICHLGPEERLKATENTQPALFTVEAILHDLLTRRGIVPALCMGHSLGEYSALYAAGALSFVDGLRLVAARGALMARAGQTTPGAMAAVIGLTPEQITQVLQTITSGVVVCANENSPDQTVISGQSEAVIQACDLLKKAGAKRAIQLPVSGAFHSPLMQAAADEFRPIIQNTTFTTLRCPVVSNVTARPESDPAVFGELLIKQLVSPVRWVASVQAANALIRGSWWEVGPGIVLQGLIRKIVPDMSVISCATAEDVYSVSPSG